MKKLIPVVAITVLTLVSIRFAYSHCEIPCGIYDDEARFNTLAEHITTVEKSMKEITALSKAGDKNYNQLVRWINNKERHATEIQTIMAQYFLTQRIKPTDGSNPAAQMTYFKKLELVHKIIVEAMKSKQTVDLEHVAKMNSLLETFREVYFAK